MVGRMVCDYRIIIYAVVTRAFIWNERKSGKVRNSRTYVANLLPERKYEKFLHIMEPFCGLVCD